MDVVYPVCAGIDVHKASVTVCLVWRDARGQRCHEVRTFGTMTKDLLAVQDWLAQQQCPMIAMESTGPYWKPVFNLLATDCEVLLVNPTHYKNVPGRKTDTKDAAWLAELLEYGLLRGSFIPPEVIRDLRELTRYRRRKIQERSAEMNRVQKVLEDANIKLGVVASDVFGVSGRAMLRALIAGEQTPAEMAELAKGALRNKREQLQEALTGRLRAHHRRLLDHMLQCIAFLDAVIADCDAAIGEVLAPFTETVERVRTITAVDLRASQDILAEIGMDMGVFPTHKHLCSWATACPGLRESGGKRQSGKTRKGNKWLKPILVQCGKVAARLPDTYLGSQYRRLAKRRGKNRATVAVAHSILTAIYFILRDGVEYHDLGPHFFDELNRDQLVRYHQQRLEEMGLRVELSKVPVAA